MDLCRICTDRLRVLSPNHETREIKKHTEDFKRKTVRIAPSCGVSRARAVADLAVVIDLFSRRVVGWAISDHRKKGLANRALETATNLHSHRRAAS